MSPQKIQAHSSLAGFVHHKLVGCFPGMLINFVQVKASFEAMMKPAFGWPTVGLVNKAITLLRKGESMSCWEWNIHGMCLIGNLDHTAFLM